MSLVKLSLIALALVLVAVPASAQEPPPIFVSPWITEIASACDSEWRAAYVANVTGKPMYLRSIWLEHGVSLPAYIGAAVYASHPGYATGPTQLMWTSSTPFSEPWDSHIIVKTYPAPVLLRPGEWLTLVAACASPGAQHQVRLMFSWTETP